MEEHLQTVIDWFMQICQWSSLSFVLDGEKLQSGIDWFRMYVLVILSVLLLGEDVWNVMQMHDTYELLLIDKVH